MSDSQSQRATAWLTGALTLVLLGLVALRDFVPPLAPLQELMLRLERVQPGTSEPLVTTGRTGAGDFLYVKYIDEHTVAFGYDKWGSGGPVSDPVRFTPGATHSLVLRLPALQNVPGYPTDGDEVQVRFEGRVVLETRVRPHARDSRQVWFARNPIGGSSCGPEFHGRLLNARGRPLVGSVDTVLSPAERFQGWLKFRPGYAIGIVLMSVGAGYAAGRLVRGGRAAVREWSARICRAPATHRAAGLTIAACVIAFAWLVTGGSWRLIQADSFGEFYDFQAARLLEARLDVPEKAIGGEAFILDGKYYGYFGPTPALIRLPFVICDLAFGELTRAAMLLYYVAALLAAYLLLCLATRWVFHQPQPKSWLTVLFILNVGLGSTIFFLGSRAYLYHEAILAGVAFALWSAWCSLRQLDAPQSHWWLGALVCGALSLHARPPTGLFALTLLGCIAAALAWRSRKTPGVARRHALLGAAAVLAVLSYNGMSYLKFKTFEGCPLRLSVQYDAKRLAAIDGKPFHVANLPFTFSTYFLRPNLRAEPRFPFLFVDRAKPDGAFAGARMDYLSATLALPYSMAGLFFLALGSAAWMWRASPKGRFGVLLIWSAAVPMTLAMLAAVAVAQRYTADFCPALIAAAGFGSAALAGSRQVLRVLLGTFLVCLTVWSIVFTAAFTLEYQGTVVWGVPEDTRARYRRMQQRIDHALPARPSLPTANTVD